MFTRSAVLLAAAICFAGTVLHGEEPGEKEAPVAPFVVTVVHGTALGAYTGLAAGWVRYADRHEMQNVWESVGYGALGGLGAGTAAAIIGKEGAGNMALNDIDAVSGFGGGMGFIWGVVSALFTGDSRRIADGMAWGQLAGVVTGIGVAGYKAATHRYAVEREEKRERAIQCSVGTLTGSLASNGAGITVRKRF